MSSPGANGVRLHHDGLDPTPRTSLCSEKPTQRRLGHGRGPSAGCLAQPRTLPQRAISRGEKHFPAAWAAATQTKEVPFERSAHRPRPHTRSKQSLCPSQAKQRLSSRGKGVKREPQEQRPLLPQPTPSRGEVWAWGSRGSSLPSQSLSPPGGDEPASNLSSSPACAFALFKYCVRSAQNRGITPAFEECQTMGHFFSRPNRPISDALLARCTESPDVSLPRTLDCLHE